MSMNDEDLKVKLENDSSSSNRELEAIDEDL